MEKYTVWEKSIQNPPETPWLDWIKMGFKKFEGRVFFKDWSKMKINDIIKFTHGEKKVEVIIVELKYYPNFVEAYQELDNQLVPGKINLLTNVIENISEEDVKNMYLQYFMEDDIKNYGVVAVGIKPIE